MAEKSLTPTSRVSFANQLLPPFLPSCVISAAGQELGRYPYQYLFPWQGE